MLLKKFDEEMLKEAAQRAFPDFYIQIEYSDIYLRNTTAGRYTAPWLKQEFYISTEYVYEDVLVNGNKTRYKVSMSCILLKKDRYDVVYDSSDVYYAAYEEDGEIRFMKYVDIIKELPKQITLLEELTPV